MKMARQVPAAFASLYLPAGRRRWHWYSYSCRTCGQHQLGRARQLEDVAGERRAGCGHRVKIVIARAYRWAA
jgi:predicted SprT family Zn-dependent metalloprotease